MFIGFGQLSNAYLIFAYFILLPSFDDGTLS